LGDEKLRARIAQSEWGCGKSGLEPGWDDPQKVAQNDVDIQDKATTLRFWLPVAIAIGLFVIARLPMIVHAPGQMDEQWFAVPGLTVLEEGIPRIPYCPTRRRETFFENADRCLFALPPALHYLQAPFFALMPPGYLPARMPPFLGGILALVMIGCLTRRLLSSPWVLGVALGMFALSRPLMFTAITARPDLLAAIGGWGALIAMWRWQDDPRPRWLLIAGLGCGAGLLCHPYAIVFCLQCGIWSLARSAPLPRRIWHGGVLTAAALLTLAAWLPLILAFPYEFESQFFSNVMERSGSGVVSRMLWPWRSLLQHWNQQLAFNEPTQFVWLIVGLPLGTIVWLFLGRNREQRRYLMIVWSAAYLTATAAGVHPTNGYWVYTIGLVYPVAVDGVFRLVRWGSKIIGARWVDGDKSDIRPAAAGAATTWPRISEIAVSLILLGLILPGSGLRTTAAYLQHWGDPRYHAPTFIQQVLERLPQEGRYMSDVSFVFDIYLSGRETILCQPRRRFWGEEELDIDYLFTGQEGMDYHWPRDYDMRWLRREGDRADPHQCWIDISIPRPKDP
jgi:hypothetical protein